MAELQNLIVAWAVVAVIVVLRHVRPRRSVGLVASYVLSLLVIHWFATAIYLLPWYDSAERDLSILGMQQSLVAIIGFLVGAEIQRSTMGPQVEDDFERKAIVPRRLVDFYLISGLVMYVLLFSAAARLPGASAVLSVGSTLIAAGIGLKMWNARQVDESAKSRAWLLVACCFPLLTVLVQGFIGYGFGALTMVLAFRASFDRLRLKQVVFVVLAAYLGLSVYTTYMRDRGLIRDVVWTGGKVEARVQQIRETIQSAEWFSFWNPRHLDRVNVRLNQNYLVGAAVDNLRGGRVQPAGGRTIMDAVLAVVPRALWPDKPAFGGSGDLVSEYTGIMFAEGTSVGVGHVLEWYINFGSAGVFGGFVLLGILLALADRWASWHLHQGNAHGFLLWYLPALNLLQVGGSLAEATAGVGAALVIVHGSRWVVRNLSTRAPVGFDEPTVSESMSK